MQIVKASMEGALDTDKEFQRRSADGKKEHLYALTAQ